jgi:hypothetical protein
MNIQHDGVSKSLAKIRAIMEVAEEKEIQKQEHSSLDDLDSLTKYIAHLHSDSVITKELVAEAKVLKKEFCDMIDESFQIEEKKKTRDNNKDFWQMLGFSGFGIGIIALLKYLETLFGYSIFGAVSIFMGVCVLFTFIGVFISSFSCLADHIRKEHGEDYQLTLLDRAYIMVVTCSLAYAVITFGNSVKI